MFIHSSVKPSSSVRQPAIHLTLSFINLSFAHHLWKT